MYQPKTGARCSCRPGIARDNCPTCEGTGWVIDFAAIRRATAAPAEAEDTAEERAELARYHSDMEIRAKTQ